MSSFDSRVLEGIERERDLNPAIFSSDTLQALAEYPRLLKIVLSADESFPPLDLKTCDRHVLQDRNLFNILGTSYARGSFEEITKHPSVLLLKRTAEDIGTGPQAAFEKSYRSNAHRAFIDVLNFYNTTPEHNLYHKSIAIIQPSGMGKSRLVQEVANEVFTFPVNLRGDVEDVKTCPPDEDLCVYFEDEFKSDELLQVEYAVLLKHMFDIAVSEIPTAVQGRGGSDLAKAWADHLADGQTDQSVGHNRLEFYKKVRLAARKELAGVYERVWVDLKELRVDPYPPLNEDDPMVYRVPGRYQLYYKLNDRNLLEEKFGAMYLSAKKMVKAVRIDRGSRKTACIVYFDKAHRLAEPRKVIHDLRSRSAYHNLGMVLSRLVNQPIFFIFLSTNSDMKQFVPPPFYHPSSRGSPGDYLIPPFTALPFDVFMAEVFKSMQTSKKPPSLVNACTARVMSSMRRPMWFVHHEEWERQKDSLKRPKHVFEFAMEKLTASRYTFNWELAALSVRIGITFEPTTSASREEEARQVESHMRVVYAIPEHWEYMQTGSPSEPVLAEAAASRAKGFLARGERGELCGRLLMTIAHDIAVAETSPQIQRLLHDPEVLFHRPVPVLAFLRALLADLHHNTILNATPATDKGGKTLGAAFENAYIFFSHFALAADSATLDANVLRTALLRGMAIQAKDNQVSINAVIPIHMGSITNPITTKTTSAINLQFKNRKVSHPCSVDRTITVPDPEQPVISIVLELGEELPHLEKEMSTSLVEVQHWDRRVTRGKKVESPPHQDDRHYLLVARGCGPETYKAIPETGGDIYASILASGVEELKPSFSAAKCLKQWDEYFLDSNISSGSAIPLGNGDDRKQATSPAKGRGRKVNEVGKSNASQRAIPSGSKESKKKRKSGEE